MPRQIALSTAQLLCFLFLSVFSHAQLQYAVGQGHLYYNQPGSTGVAFDTNAAGHWNCFGNTYSTVLIVKDFQFAIPDSAHIRGIRVDCDVIIHNLEDSSIYLLRYGVPYGTDGARRVPIVAASSITWGDTSTLWGGIWGPMALNDTGFGIKLRLRDTGNASVPMSWGDANPVYITVAYDFAVPNSISMQQETPLRIFPNPAGNWLVADWGGNRIASVTLLDITGRVVQSCEGDRIDARSIPGGSYLLSVKSDAGYSTMQRVVVRH